MLASLRTFRLPAALLAALMLLSGSMPLVQHACAMLAKHLHACCDEHAATPPRHGHDAHTPPPCHDALPLDAHGTPATTDCCLVESTPALPARASLLDAPSSRLLALLPSLRTDALPAPGRSPSLPLFFDTGAPPGSPVALHLLHAALLT